MSTPNAPAVLPSPLLDREQLRAVLGRRLSPASFSNWLHRATLYRGFPRPLVVAERSVAWRLAEVVTWLEARPRSGADRSPRPRTDNAGASATSATEPPPPAGATA